MLGLFDKPCSLAIIRSDRIWVDVQIDNTRLRIHSRIFILNTLYCEIKRLNWKFSSYIIKILKFFLSFEFCVSRQQVPVASVALLQTNLRLTLGSIRPTYQFQISYNWTRFKKRHFLGFYNKYYPSLNGTKHDWI